MAIHDANGSSISVLQGERMDLEDTINTVLATSSPLADGNPDLSVALLRLASSALAGVPSWLALRVTEAGNEQQLTIYQPSYSSGKAHARSSLRLEVDSTVHAGLSRSFVFLAEEANAFDDFRQFRTAGPCEDASSGATTPAGPAISRLVVDGDVPIAGTGELTSVGDKEAADSDRVIDRAIGVLLERGWSDARGELTARAHSSGRTLLREARAVLGSVEQ
jgi:hypothetical protein